MSCFFCNSSFHLSQYCDLHFTDESKSKFAQENGYCPVCFCFINKFHNEFLCGFNLKCFICFSKKHHTFYCPNKNTVSYFFLPLIDEDLVPRFLSCFNVFDKILLGLSSLESLRLIELKPIRIRNDLTIEKDLPRPYSNCITVAADNFKLENVDPNSKNFLQHLNSNQLKIKAKDISLQNVQISSQELLLLLSQYTTSLQCNKLKLTSKVTFREILEKIPNIEIIEFHDAQIEMTNSWPEDFMKYKNGNNFKQLEINIKDNDFNVQTLAFFMKSKCSPNAQIHLHVQISNPEDHETIKNKFDTFFVSATSFSNEVLKVHISHNDKAKELLYNLQ